MLNAVILMGRFAKTPQLEKTNNGTEFTKFSIAVSRSHKDTNGERIVDWIDCVAWKTTAEFISKHFNKGDPIIVEGSIQTRNYEDKQGNKKKAFDVLVGRVNFAYSAKKEAENINSQEVDDTDLPF
jgi:single-strand DNA-binding protein